MEEFSAVTTQLLDLYRAKARNRLQPVACEIYVFPGATGGPKNPVVLTRQIGTLTNRECHIRITASQFKYVVGFLHLKLHPGNYKHVRDLLGYVSIKAVEKVFGQLATQAAFERADDRLAMGEAHRGRIELEQHA